MDNPVTLRSPAPAAREADAAERRPVRRGADSPLNVELQTRVPDIGPIKLGEAGSFYVQVYPGPLLKVVAASSSGGGLDATA